MNGKKQFIEFLTKATYIRTEFGLRTMRGFGSMARGEEKDDSDVDADRI